MDIDLLRKKLVGFNGDKDMRIENVSYSEFREAIESLASQVAHKGDNSKKILTIGESYTLGGVTLPVPAGILKADNFYMGDRNEREDAVEDFCMKHDLLEE